MDCIDDIRAFSRFYTGRLGLLGRSYLGSGLGVAEVRLLHDLDAPEPCRARDLARVLALDEAQVSRSLAGFERRGWISRVPAKADARARAVVLTPEGRALVAGLKAQSRAAIAPLVAPLPAGARSRLSAALAEVKQLLSGTDTVPVLRPLAPGDAGWIISRHGALYAEDEGYDASFEALVARILSDFILGHDPARERGWIAERAGVPVGSIFCMAEGAHAPDTARLRLFLVEKTERGSGLAQQMLDACLDFARLTGYRRMVLWTHESHRAAGRLYARNGFALRESRPARAFGQDTVEQIWDREL